MGKPVIQQIREYGTIAMFLFFCFVSFVLNVILSGVTQIGAIFVSSLVGILVALVIAFIVAAVIKLWAKGKDTVLEIWRLAIIIATGYIVLGLLAAILLLAGFNVARMAGLV